MSSSINRTLKDLRYLITAESWKSGKSVAHAAPEKRFQRLYEHGWVENLRNGWMEDHPDPEKQRAYPVVIADLTPEGIELREQYTLDDIRGADSLGDVLE